MPSDVHVRGEQRHDKGDRADQPLLQAQPEASRIRTGVATRRLAEHWGQQAYVHPTELPLAAGSALQHLGLGRAQRPSPLWPPSSLGALPLAMVGYGLTRRRKRRTCWPADNTFPPDGERGFAGVDYSARTRYRPPRLLYQRVQKRFGRFMISQGVRPRQVVVLEVPAGVLESSAVMRW